MIYLIEYNRKIGKLLRLEEFQPTDCRQAEEKRLRVSANQRAALDRIGRLASELSL